MDTRGRMRLLRVSCILLPEIGVGGRWETLEIGLVIGANIWELVVSRAFQVLSDPDKKSKFDKFGQDPDNRFAGNASAAGGASPFSGFRSPGGGRGPMFEEEISPEELFRQFFGGGGFGGGGGPFGTSNRFTNPLETRLIRLHRLRHRPWLRFQSRRRPWSTSAPIRRR